tara:strand:- start:387 stop:1802 length:1416 start_codon:yes stop_codon:yes gene_type:complete
MYPLYVDTYLTKNCAFNMFIRSTVFSCLFLLSFYSYSKSWLNKEEEKKYKEIISESSVSVENTELQEMISLKVQKQNDYKSNVRKIIKLNSELDGYVQDVKYSSEVNEYKISNKISKNISERLKASRKNEGLLKSINTTNNHINDIKLKINRVNQERVDSLLSLSKLIIERLRNEWQGKNKKVFLKGEFKCDDTQSIKSCLLRNESIITIKLREENGFIADSQNLKGYKVDKASMDFNGNLDYQISLDVSPVLTDKIVAQVNSYLGINEVSITLTSNVEAVWYVDGNKVGKGKELIYKTSTGKHNFVAAYEGKTESTVEQVVDGKKYHYYFKKVRKAVQKPREDVEQVKQPVVTNNEINSVVSETSTSKPNYKKDLPKELLTKSGNQSYFIMGQLSNPVLGSEGVSACKAIGRPAELIEYLSLMDVLDSNPKNTILPKYTIYTDDFGAVRVTEASFENSVDNNSVTICIVE